MKEISNNDFWNKGRNYKLDRLIDLLYQQPLNRNQDDMYIMDLLLGVIIYEE